MCLFDELLVWKTNASQLDGIEVHIYNCGEEINRNDIDDFSYEHYTLHDKDVYLAEIQLRKKETLNQLFLDLSFV